MADLGHELTEEELKRLERKIKREYKTAVADMKAKLTEYLEATEEQRKIQKALLDAGKITKQEYKNWVIRHDFVKKQFKDTINVLAQDMVHANEIALQIAKQQMPDIYALNANYATYQIEHGASIDTSFTLYNHDTAEYLMKEQRQLMPRPSAGKAAQIAANKDMQWNAQKIQSAVLQGVLQGEPPYKVAQRLMSVGQMNYNSAVRYARTMGTAAQNAGRYQAFRRAESVGVDLTIEWAATLDGRTRHDHRMMHGQRRNVDEPFELPDGHKILYPADSTGTSDVPQKEIWNCRCTLLSWVKGFEGDTVKSSPKMGNMSFEEWQNEHAPKVPEVTPQNVASQATSKEKYPDMFKGTKGLSDTYKAGFSQAINASANEDAKDVYAHYADQLVCKDDASKRAFFRAFDGGTYLNTANDTKGNTYEVPFEVGAHEFGHMIDWLGGKKNHWQYLSNTPNADGTRLQDVIKKDFQTFKKSLGVSRAQEVIPILKAENMTLKTRGNISDILEKCTGVAYPLGVGHGTSYHKRDGATEREFFTEVISSAAVNPDSYAQMKRLFPNAVDMVWDLIKGAM